MIERLAAARISDARLRFGPAVMAAMALCALPAAAAAAPNGKALFEERCTACHTVKKSEPANMGPILGGVVGRKVASVPKWAYTPALKAAGGQWTEARLNAFLTDPQKVARGTSMGYQEPSAADRAAIIQHLKTLKP